MLEEIWLVIRGYFKRLDKILLLLCVLAMGFGLVILYSEYVAGFLSSSKMNMQILAVSMGILALLVMSAISYRLMAKLWFLHMPVTLGLVLITFTNLSIVKDPPAGSDDTAWLQIGSFSLQPSELLKFSFILTFAYHLSKVRDEINRPLSILLLCIHGAIPSVLIFMQGDMGSALVFFFIFLCMIFTAGISYKYIFLGMGAIGILAPVIWFSGMLPTYLKNRFLVLFDLDNSPLTEAYHQRIGRKILGSGMVFGKGLFSDDFSDFFAIENDFVLSHVGQALGFVGCAFVVLLLTVICVKILLVARSSKDAMGCYICTGVFAMFLFQFAINVGMVLAVLPVIGITLPFISAGGTSVITSSICMGLVMSVYAYNRK